MKATQAAQLRATISSVLSSDAREFSTEEIAAAIGQSPRTAGQILGGMSRGGLIVFGGKHGKQKWWSWPVSPETPTPRKRSKAEAADEVELCVGGKTIIVGRNETTGRIRITIET